MLGGRHYRGLCALHFALRWGRVRIMIRFIDLGKQIAVDETDPDYPRQFAFFNTIDSQFVKINGEVVFDSFGDLIQQIELDESVDERFCNRLMGLTPDWVRTVPAPRHNAQVWGIKG